jgi:hypothetical protein
MDYSWMPNDGRLHRYARAFSLAVAATGAAGVWFHSIPIL